MRLVGADVFDGEVWLPGTDLLIDGDRIVGIGDAQPDDARARQPHDGEQHDLRGLAVLPGLVDAHMHLFPGFLQRLPAFGVTAVLDLFSTPRLLRRLRTEETAPGAARFTSAGTGAAPSGGHPHQLAKQGLYEPFPALDRTSQIPAFVAARVAEGAAFVKVFLEDGATAGVQLPLMAPATARRLVETAHAHGLPVVAHATSTRTAFAALEAGCDGLAHLPVPVDSGEIRELVDRAHELGTFVISTLVSLASLLGQDVAARLLTDATRMRVGPKWREHLDRRAGPSDHPGWGRVLALCAALAERGVPLLAGTDAAFPGVIPGASLHAEMALLASCGIAPDAVLAAATSQPATFLWPGAGGRIRVGARADLVILAGDPRRDLQATQKVVACVVGGHLLTRGDENLHTSWPV